MQDQSTGRFALFTDAELVELWDGLTMDDGIRYGFLSELLLRDNEQVAWTLAHEVHAEAVRRDLTHHDENRWENVL